MIRAERHRFPYGGWAVLKVGLLTIHTHQDAHTAEVSIGLGNGRTWGLRVTVTGNRWKQQGKG